MFDHVTMLGADAARVPCGQGHAQAGFQTKDFDPGMDEYFVFEGRLYKKLRREERSLMPSLERGRLVLLRQSHAEPVQFTGGVVVYNHCDACEPVYCEGHGDWNGGIDERGIWLEYELAFTEGRLTKVTPLKVTSRDGLRLQLVKEGQPVLPDDDRVVRRHRELRRRTDEGDPQR